jgi:hypothetical protein
MGRRNTYPSEATAGSIGISYQMPAAVEAANNVALHAAAAAKQAAQIHSPSKVFADIGQMMVMGLEVGIRGESPFASEAMMDTIRATASGAAYLVPQTVNNYVCLDRHCRHCLNLHLIVGVPDSL